MKDRHCVNCRNWELLRTLTCACEDSKHFARVWASKSRFTETHVAVWWQIAKPDLEKQTASHGKGFICIPCECAENSPLEPGVWTINHCMLRSLFGSSPLAWGQRARLDLNAELCQAVKTIAYIIAFLIEPRMSALRVTPIVMQCTSWLAV